MLNKQQVCDRLGISSATLQRRMAAGSITYVKEGEGNFAQCYFPEEQFEAVPVEFPETTPLAASRSEEKKPADPLPISESTEGALPDDYGHHIDRLEEWTSSALRAGQAVWILPARAEGGVTTNKPDFNSRNMPTPENWNRWTLANDILIKRSAHAGEIPKHKLRKAHGYWPKGDNHNILVSSLGQAETTEELNNWLHRSADGSNPLRNIPKELL
jgi:hypothetical protein